MSTFVISPHMRLQEWVAHDKGYFNAEGLKYEFKTRTGSPSVKSAEPLPKDQIRGAYQSIESGMRQTTDVSCACHWTINMAAAASSGVRLIRLPPQASTYQKTQVSEILKTSPIFRLASVINQVVTIQPSSRSNRF